MKRLLLLSFGLFLCGCDPVSSYYFELTNAVPDTCVIHFTGTSRTIRLAPGATAEIYSLTRMRAHATDLYADEPGVQLPEVEIRCHDTLVSTRNYNQPRNWVYMQNSQHRGTYRSLIRPKDF